MDVTPKKAGLYWAILVLFDQGTKFWASTTLTFFEPKIIFPFLWFQLVHNYGAAYGIFQYQRWPLVIFGWLVILGLMFFWKKWAHSTWLKWGMVFLLAGTVGNLLDRMVLGYVVDFVYVHIFPVFNVADVLIDIGIGCVIVDLFVSKHDSPAV